MIIKKIFRALGNDRPQILVQLEDHVLQAIIGISQGNSREEAMGTLYSQILSLENDLANDNKAMGWFNLCADPSSIPSSIITSEFPSTPLEASPNVVIDKFKGKKFLFKYGH